MNKEERFEIFNEYGKWVIKDNEELPSLLDSYLCCVRLNKFAEQVADLEAKLAEYEKELMDNEKCFTEKDVEGLIKDREETIKFLKQQLAEKEEAIKLATRIANVACKPPLTIEELKKESKKQFQDKIEFAVEQLTQAIKNIKKCNYKDFGIMYQSDAIAVIDNQIKQLKEGK